MIIPHIHYTFAEICLGVAVGLSVAILLLILVSLYCCERYIDNKKLGKLLRLLGAPHALSNGSDEFETSKPNQLQDQTDYRKQVSSAG